MEEKRKEVEAKFQTAVKTAQQLLKEISEMRNVDFSDVNPDNAEETAEVMKLAQELDERTKYLLKGLLIPYGGVLFL